MEPSTSQCYGVRIRDGSPILYLQLLADEEIIIRCFPYKSTAASCLHPPTTSHPFQRRPAARRYTLIRPNGRDATLPWRAPPPPPRRIPPPAPRAGQAPPPPGPAVAAAARQRGVAHQLARRDRAPAAAPLRALRPRRGAPHRGAALRLRRRPPHRARGARRPWRSAGGPPGVPGGQVPRRGRQHHHPRQLRSRVAPPAPQPRRRDAAPVAGEALRAGARVGAPRARPQARRARARRRASSRRGHVPVRYVFPPRAHVLRRAPGRARGARDRFRAAGATHLPLQEHASLQLLAGRHQAPLPRAARQSAGDAAAHQGALSPAHRRAPGVQEAAGRRAAERGNHARALVRGHPARHED